MGSRNRQRKLSHQGQTATTHCLPSRRHSRILACVRAWPGNSLSHSPVAESVLRIPDESRRLATFRRLRPRLSPAARSDTHGPLGIYLAHAAGIASVFLVAYRIAVRGSAVLLDPSHLLR